MDERLFRPAEVDHLLGDPSRARNELGWQPGLDFESLVNMMVDADVARLEAGPITRPSAAVGP